MLTTMGAGNTTRARTVLAVLWGTLCSLILAAPVLASLACFREASFLYFLFSPICHQITERSFSVGTFSLAVCHRCTGIYLGLFLGPFMQYRIIGLLVESRRLCVACACLPMFVDIFLSLSGIWPGTYLSRFSTGLLFGILVSPLLILGLAELIEELRSSTSNSLTKSRLQPRPHEGDI